MKKIPYGISNFKILIQEDYLYMDKTDFIQTMEEDSRYLVMLRPRRFGKSLLLSTLQYYYDEQESENFDTLFGHLIVGQNPTAQKNSYKILFFEFSRIETEDRETIYRGFLTNVQITLLNFLDKYGYREYREEIESIDSPEDMMKTFFSIIKGSKIYLLIDEYDHFANSILAEDLELFKKIVGKGGFVRSFYETIKAETQTGVVDRAFITGVTPITMDSMTSGFNIGDDMSTEERYNSMLGFTKEETLSILQRIFDVCDITQKKVLSKVTKWYNGYKFNTQAEETIFNPNMLLYFINEFDYKRCNYPQNMLDANIASDYGKIMRLFKIGNKEENFKVLDSLIQDNEIIAKLIDRFDFDRDFVVNDFVNLLYYMGFITQKASHASRVKFCIPNYVIHKLYFEYFKVELEKRGNVKIDTNRLEDALYELAFSNDITLLMDEYKNALQVLANRDFLKLDEKHVQVILLTLLNLSDLYFVKSEQAYSRKYPDIMLLERSPFKVNFQFLLEIKYYKKSQPQEKALKIKEGIEQVKGYLELDDIKELENLKAYVIVSDGFEVEVVRVG